MNIQEFKKKVRNLTAGKGLVYHSGRLADDRLKDADLNKVAAFALAVAELGYGHVFQRRINCWEYDYELRVNKRLGMRRDENGSFQECERVAAMYMLNR